MSKILITTSSFGTEEALKKLQDHGFEVILNPYKRKLTTPELKELLPGVIGLIAGTEKIDRETMQNSNLKVISRVGTGIDNIDLVAAKELGIIVKNTPDAPTLAVAELTLGGILCLLRQIPQMHQAVCQKVWEKKMGVQLSGKTILIIGFGRIGKTLAKLLGPFDVKLLVVDPTVPGLSLKEALPQADVICLHAGGKERILGLDEFKVMKKGVFLVNTARGELIDEAALVEALKSGQVAGAYIDVFSKEPYDGSLIESPQVILTPHVGSYTQECRIQMEMEAVENLLTVI